MTSSTVSSKMSGKSAQSMAVWMLLLTTCFTVVCGQFVEYDDVTAGRHIDYISDKGIGLLLLWKDRFDAKLDAITATVDEAEAIITEHFSSENLPNVTKQMEDSLVNISNTLDQAEAILNTLNLTEKDEGQPAFMETSSNTVDTDDNHDDTTFVVPMDGLYMVSLKNSFYFYSQTLKIMKNGDDTLTSMEVSYYYDVQLRIALVELEEGDEITTTSSGEDPTLFGVTLLRLQTLMPNTL